MVCFVWCLFTCLQERIAELEAEAIGDRPWQLKGEVAAAQRPINSALEVRTDRGQQAGRGHHSMSVAGSR